MKGHLTEEHIQALRSALQGLPLEAVITLVLVTGMRRDELLHLTWQDLDLEKCELRVLNSKRSMIIERSPHQTECDYRTIPLPNETIETLQQHRLHQEKQRTEVGFAWKNLDLIFPNSTGGLLAPYQLVQEWSNFLAQTALPPIRLHDLRKFRQQEGKREP